MGGIKHRSFKYIKEIGKDKDGKVSKYLHSSIFGRVLSEDIKKNKTIIQYGDKKKLTKGTFIDAEVLDAISKSGVDSIKVLSPFNSLDPESMEPLCYGFSLATGSPVEEGIV